MGYRPNHADPDVTVISFNAKQPEYWSDRVNVFLNRRFFFNISKQIKPYAKYYFYQPTTQQLPGQRATPNATMELKVPT